LRPRPTLEWLEASVHRLTERLPRPSLAAIGNTKVYRFEKSIHAAIVLKTARYISGLSAGELLLSHGFLQELGALQRTIGEFGEDAMFLALACLNNNIEQIHEEFLSSFWEEQPEYHDFVRDQRKKPEVKRSKIQAYISGAVNGGIPDHQELATSKYMSHMYSGFIHAAAPHIMDMYDPETERLDVRGIASRFLREAYEHDFENYIFRSVPLIATASKALGDDLVHRKSMEVHETLKPHYT
jgi:hypothetical protein